MNKLAYMVVLSSLISVGSAMAGGACCGMKAVAATEGEQEKMGNVPSQATCKALCEKLNLTEEQKTKVDEIIAACPSEGCKPEDMEKCVKALGSVLTAEQMEQFKGECRKSCGAACPAMKAEPESAKP